MPFFSVVLKQLADLYYLLLCIPAIFVLHHPEHGHAIVHPILSRIIDGTLVYDKNDPPFSSFISLFSQNNEVSHS